MKLVIARFYTSNIAKDCQQYQYSEFDVLWRKDSINQDLASRSYYTNKFQVYGSALSVDDVCVILTRNNYNFEYSKTVFTFSEESMFRLLMEGIDHRSIFLK
jgi:hypothetical protein